MCQALCLSTILASSLHQNSSLNPLVHIWGSMKCGVRSLAICCLLQWIWCYPVFSLWNSACSQVTLECMRVWYLATHHGNDTGVVFVLVDDNDKIVQVAEPQIPANPKICINGFSTVMWWTLDTKVVDKNKAWQTAAQLCLPVCYSVV